MKWYDAADDAKRRNAAIWDAARKACIERNLSAESTREAMERAAKKFEEFVEGVSYRTDDGTPYGLWRVTVDAPDATTWSVWDCRRGAHHLPRGIRIVSGLRTPQHAMMLAEWYARTKVARGAFAVLRGVQAAVAMVREEWRL